MSIWPPVQNGSTVPLSVDFDSLIIKSLDEYPSIYIGSEKTYVSSMCSSCAALISWNLPPGMAPSLLKSSFYCKSGSLAGVASITSMEQYGGFCLKAWIKIIVAYCGNKDLFHPEHKRVQVDHTACGRTKSFILPDKHVGKQSYWKVHLLHHCSVCIAC